eukprot:9500267-Pyramimonas_sp.AAC.1
MVLDCIRRARVGQNRASNDAASKFSTANGSAEHPRGALGEVLDIHDALQTFDGRAEHRPCAPTSEGGAGVPDFPEPWVPNISRQERDP